MSFDSLSYDTTFDGSDEPPKQPSKLLFYLGSSSILIGLIIGIFGVLTRTQTSVTQQHLIGGTGYVLTALLPIIFLQLIRRSHLAALSINQEEPYDIYAGTRLELRFRKVVGIGLLSASLSILTFFLPIAEGFAA